MPGTTKFSISMPASEFKALEAGRRKAGRTRSQYIRDILMAERIDAKELTDASELRRRAIAAAGCFESGLTDLSIGHDRHLADPPDEDEEKGLGTSDKAGGRR